MQHIIRHLFKAGSLEEVPKERLEELVQEYPSFSVGHYLLSSKLHAEEAANFYEATERTNLYFPNPFWLQWQLQNANKENGVTRSWPVAHGDMEVPLFVPELDRSEDAFEKLAPAELTEAPLEEQEPIVRAATEEGYVNAEELEKIEEEAVVAEPEEIVVAEPGEVVAAGTEEVVAAEVAPWEEELGSQDGDGVAEKSHAEDHAAEESSADKLLKSIMEARSLRQSLAEIHDRIAGEAEEVPAAAVEAVVPDAPQEESMKVQEEPSEVQEKPAEVQEEPSEVHEEPAIPGHVETPVAPVSHEELAIPGHVEIPVRAEVPVVPDVQEETIPDAPRQEVIPAGPLFQSFHTIDYFASQGIKLSLDENPNDRLGRQMKSFTDWLKVMKRIPQKDAASVPDLAAEHQVQAIAAHSIEGKEVVTETMAEVLAKQGMREKATEVYRKLSLLNPEKSSYFAARIEELKII